MNPEERTVAVWASELKAGLLPAVCVKSGWPADKRLTFHFATYGWPAFLLLGPMLAPFVGRRGEGPLPLTKHWHAIFVAFRVVVIGSATLAFVTYWSLVVVPKSWVPGTLITLAAVIVVYVVSHTTYAGLRPKGTVYASASGERWVELRDVHKNFVHSVIASAPAPSARISSDGLWYWNGTTWLSSISEDGHWKWDGASWRSTGNSERIEDPGPQLPAPPTALRTRLVIASLLVSIAAAAIIGAVALEAAARTEIPDWQYLSVLSGIVISALLLTLGLIALPPASSRAFIAPGGGWRLPAATSTLAFGIYAVVIWLLLIVGGVLTVPDFLSGAGRGSGRDAFVGALLVVGPALALGFIGETAYWRASMLARVPIRSTSVWLLGLALLSGVPLLLVLSNAQGGGQLAVVLVGLLAPSVLALIGLSAKREWGRVITTLACLCWACTGVGLVVAVPLFLVVWIPGSSSSRLSTRGMPASGHLC